MDWTIIQKNDEEIIKKIGMAKLPLILYVLNKKYDGRYKLIDIGNDCMFRFGETNVANTSYLATIIHRIIVEDNYIKIKGDISWPAIIREELHFYVKKNGDSFECEISPGIFDVFTDEGDLYEKKDIFDVKIPLSKGLNEISFVYECNGIYSESGKINAMRHVPVSDILPKQYAEVNGWLMKISNGKLLIEKNDSKDDTRRILENTFCTSIKDKRIISLRKKYFERLNKKKRQIWLFMDRLEKADDNGEVFFRYVLECKDLDIDAYFIISRESPDFERLQECGNVIEAMTDEHYLLLFLADYIFTSQLNGWVENPFIGKEEYFRDIYHHAKVVFLQHGVTKDDHSKWLNNIKQNLFAVVTSSTLETKDMERLEYGFEKEQIWNVGMPRFDLLYKEEPKYVLIVPTWRKGIMSQKYIEELKTYRWIINDNEKKNQYFYKYHSLLSNTDFKKICRQNGYEPAFLAHPLMQDYIDFFDIPEDVTVLPYNSVWRDVFAQSAVMITDYSSVAFDFAYLERPIIYYQFDKESFFENHSYKKGYFEYETMGFGDVVNDEIELNECLGKILHNGCVLEDRYLGRIHSFFYLIDGDNCKRLLDRVQKNIGRQLK
ncbi:MAG: CDP-glycerol glycerophosphotransferase family protein [Lachnospiraceae bacterium]|nr:CDP-glycerol glycerophosphotransferase family protein [Lachnospiraceae bacterium]